MFWTLIVIWFAASALAVVAWNVAKHVVADRSTAPVVAGRRELATRRWAPPSPTDLVTGTLPSAPAARVATDSLEHAVRRHPAGAALRNG